MKDIKFEHSKYKYKESLIKKLVKFKSEQILIINNQMKVILEYKASELLLNYSLNFKKIISDVIREEYDVFIMVLIIYGEHVDISKHQASFKKMYNSLNYLDLRMTNLLYFNGEELFDIKYY